MSVEVTTAIHRGALENLLSLNAFRLLLQNRNFTEVRPNNLKDCSLFPECSIVAVVPGTEQFPEMEISKSSACVILRDVLPYIKDYRTYIAGCFSQLKIGDLLLVAVPHQFLFERKLRPPSRIAAQNARFYTAASLLAEIEEALNPIDYRLRHLSEIDSDYNPSQAMSGYPKGNAAILACIEKCGASPGLGHVTEIDSPVRVENGFSRFVSEQNRIETSVISSCSSSVTRILIVKLDHRGDFILAEKAFRAVRSAFPDAYIELCCGPWNVGDASSLKIFNSVISFEFFPEDGSAVNNRVPQQELAQRFRSLLSDRSYDLAIDLRIYEDTRDLLRLVNARWRAGFDPYSLFPWLDMKLAVAPATKEGRAEQGAFPASMFQCKSKFALHKGTEIVLPASNKVGETSAPLIWGPYRSFAAGRYRFDVMIEPKVRSSWRLLCSIYRADKISYDICCDGGDRILQFGMITSECNDISFSTNEAVESLEFRIKLEGRHLDWRFLGLRYRRFGSFEGLHQIECMMLLVALVQHRMSSPIRIDTVYEGR